MRDSQPGSHEEAKRTELLAHEAPTTGELIAENMAVRINAGIMHLEHRAYLRIGGPDRSSFLQGIITNDVSNLKEGDGLHAALLNVKGHILADFILLAFQDHYLLETEVSIAEKLRSVLSRYKIREKVTIENVNDLTALGVQGPDSPAITERITGSSLLGLSPYHYATAQIDQNMAFIRSQSITGDKGFIIATPKSSLRNLQARLMKDGLEPGLREVGYDAMESLRIEGGIPRYGFDITEENIPLEIDDQDMVSFTKGCYVGQETVARLHFLGQANKHLRGLLITNGPSPQRDARINVGGREIGKVTSSTYSPTLNQNIAMAYLRREYSSKGTEVLVESNGTEYPATVTDLPFIKR